jgi:hypothetical protein
VLLGGWTRLWIVIGAGWLLFVSFLLYQVHSSDAAEAAYSRDRDVRYACEYTTYDERAGGLVDHSLLSMDDLTLGVIARGDPSAETRKAASECQRAKLVPLESYLQERRRQLLADAKTAAWIALFPPLALLALGIAVRWIYRGFRATPSKPA